MLYRRGGSAFHVLYRVYIYVDRNIWLLLFEKSRVHQTRQRLRSYLDKRLYLHLACVKNVKGRFFSIKCYTLIPNNDFSSPSSLVNDYRLVFNFDTTGYCGDSDKAWPTNTIYLYVYM